MMEAGIVRLDSKHWVLSEEVRSLEVRTLEVVVRTALDGDVIVEFASEAECQKQALRIATEVNEILQNRIAVSAGLRFFLNGKYSPKGQTHMIIKDTEKVSASVEFDDAAGFATTDAGATIVWASSDPTIVAVTPSADGLSAEFAPAVPPKLGAVQVSMKATKDGSPDIIALGDLEVVAGDAVSAKVNFGAPEPV